MKIPVAVPIVQNVAIGILTQASYLGQALLVAQVLTLLMQAEYGAHVITALWWLVAVVVLRALLLWLTEITALRIARISKTVLRQRLLDQLVRFGPGLSLLHPAAALQNTVIAGVDALEGYYSRYLPAVLTAPLACGLVLAVMAWVDGPTALLLMLFVIACPLCDWLWMRWQMPKASSVFSAMGDFAAELLDALQGLVTLKVFGASPRWRARLANRAAALRQASMTTLRVTLIRSGLTRMITLSGIALVLMMNAWRVAEHQLTPFTLLLTLFIAREAFRPLAQLENAFYSAWAASGARAPVDALLTLTAPVAEPANPCPRPLHFDLHIDRISFRYPDGRQALSDVSLQIPERQFIALVGPSGAGKSTLATLLIRCFDPDLGTIFLGGTDITELPLATLREMISVVSQDVFLFHGSIADNLRIARPDASDEALHQAAEQAQIADFIQQLPAGYDTPVGERGAQLSGGQRQRLAIARALLKDAPILILDEATASVDAASERALRDALAQLSGRTVIAIAHRLESIRHADRILVFDNGRLAEQGTHTQLVAANGRYAQLLAAQEEKT
ncbi:ABC transporter ATP-binding protein [Pseudomonas graminis]